MYSSEVFFLSFLSVSLGCRHGIVIFIFLFIKRSKKNKKFQKKKTIVTRSLAFSRALRQLSVISSSFDWFTVLSVFFVIG